MVKKASGGKKKKGGSLRGSPPKRVKLTSQRVESASVRAVKVDTAEEAFPRGGQQTLTPLEKSVIRSQAKQDVLFSEEPIEIAKKPEKLSHAQKPKKFEPKPVKRIKVLSKESVVPGIVLLGAVLEVNELHVVFSLPFNLRGVVAISDVSSHVTELIRANTQQSASDDVPPNDEVPALERLFSVGQVMPCCVQAIKGSLINLSVNPHLVNSHLSAKDLKPNQLLLGSVKSIEDHGYIIDFGIADKIGFLLERNAAEFVKVCQRDMSLCVGQVLHCAVLSATKSKAISVSINPSHVTTLVLSQDLSVPVGFLQPGLLVKAIVKKVTSNGLHVDLSPQIVGFIPLLRVSKDIKVLKNLKKYYAEGQEVRCVVVDSAKKIPELSIIGSVDLQEGLVTVGRVDKEVPGSHLFINVPGGRGRLDITDTSDHYQPNPFQLAQKGGKLVRCCVVRKEDSKIDLSLRESRLDGGEGGAAEVQDPEITCLEDIGEGKVVRGYIKAMTDVGAFVRLGRGIDGRVQITHLQDGFKKDFKKLYEVGELVKTKVLKVHHETGKIDLSLRLSLVDPEAAKLKNDKRKRKREREKEDLGSDGESKEEIGKQGSICSEDEDSSNAELETSEDDDLEDMMGSDDEGDAHCTAKPTLSLAGGFRWETGREAGVRSEEKSDTDDSSSEEEMEMETSSKKTRRQKKAAKKLEELQLYRKERLLLDTEKEPESAEDFDHLLLSCPNQSSLWVQYMAFYLNTAEVDKARAIAQRALRTIAFTEESEKLNVWVGWMNLENLYGTPESLAGVFESALEKCEPLEVYKKLAVIYETSGKADQASKLYQTMTKKFGSSQWVWSRYMRFLMQQKRCDQARSVLQRALKMLKGKQDHITTISNMSTLEYKHGDPERGRTMFESLISTYPRKVDVWSVYIDAVIKTKDHQRVRELFERATNLKLSAQKMKAIYKKYLSFESEHGSQTMAEVVLEKARNYVSSYKPGMDV